MPDLNTETNIEFWLQYPNNTKIEIFGGNLKQINLPKFECNETEYIVDGTEYVVNVIAEKRNIIDEMWDMWYKSITSSYDSVYGTKDYEK